MQGISSRELAQISHLHAAMSDHSGVRRMPARSFFSPSGHIRRLQSEIRETGTERLRHFLLLTHGLVPVNPSVNPMVVFCCGRCSSLTVLLTLGGEFRVLVGRIRAKALLAKLI